MSELRRADGRQVLEWLSQASDDEWGFLMGAVADEGLPPGEGGMIMSVRPGVLDLFYPARGVRLEAREWSWLAGVTLKVPPDQTELFEAIAPFRRSVG
jgi:hypothetical protein